MTREFFIIPFLLALLDVQIFPVEIEVLKMSDGINFTEKMEKNNVFIGRIAGIEIDDNNNFYFLDKKYSTILNVDSETGKLMKSISSKGQGPGELQRPKAFRIKNQMIFVADMGFGGVKIFNSTDGKVIKEFKTGHIMAHYIDVGKKNEIYLLEYDKEPAINMYNMQGEKVKTVVRFPPKTRKNLEFYLSLRAKFKLDNEENVVVLQPGRNLLIKYNKEGDLIWQKKLQNELLDRSPLKVEFSDGGVQVHGNVTDFDIDKNENILIAHVFGGSILDINGKDITLIKYDTNIEFIKVYDNNRKILITCLHDIYIYDYKKGGQ